MGPSDFLLTNRIVKKPWVVTSKIKLQRLWLPSLASSLTQFFSEPSLWGRQLPCCKLPYGKAQLARNWCVWSISDYTRPGNSPGYKFGCKSSHNWGLIWPMTPAPADTLETAASWETLSHEKTWAEPEAPSKAKFRYLTDRYCEIINVCYLSH